MVILNPITLTMKIDSHNPSLVNLTSKHTRPSEHSIPLPQSPVSTSYCSISKSSIAFRSPDTFETREKFLPLRACKIKKSKQQNKSYTSNEIWQSSHFHCKRGEHKHSQQRLGQTQPKHNRANTKSCRSMSSIYGLGWNHLGSKGLEQLCPLSSATYIMLSPLSWADSTQACSFPWQMSHCSGISKLMGYPLQCRVHFHQFVHYLLRDSCKRRHPCQHIAWSEQFSGPLA